MFEAQHGKNPLPRLLARTINARVQAVSFSSSGVGADSRGAGY